MEYHLANMKPILSLIRSRCLAVKLAPRHILDHRKKISRSCQILLFASFHLKFESSMASNLVEFRDHLLDLVIYHFELICYWRFVGDPPLQNHFLLHLMKQFLQQFSHLYIPKQQIHEV